MSPHRLGHQSCVHGRPQQLVNRAWCVQERLSPFTEGPPWAELPFMVGLAAERAKIVYHNFLKAAPQLPARPLTWFYETWQSSCVLTDWLNRTLKLGYSLQFCGLPPAFRGIREINLSSLQEIDFLEREIQDLMSKQAVSIVPAHDRERGFYSPYFLVPKKTGDYRPILDLRALNMRIGRKTFRMLTTRKLLELVQPGDWFTTIDLKDAYFHVEVAPKHRKFLRFAFQGTAYEYNRLPFGYSLAPRTFSKCVDAALQPLRGRGMRVFFYLDDLIVMARSEQWAIFHTAQLILHLTKLGFAINWKKSNPQPSQQAEYLGIVLDSVSLRAVLSESRRTALQQEVLKLRRGSRVTALTVMQALGHMAAAHPVVPLGLLHMRRLQRWFTSLHLDLKRQKFRLLTVPSTVQGNLRYWGSPQHLLTGTPLGRVTSYTTVFTDASLKGWGGTCLGRAIGGVWPPGEERHINLLELQAVFLVLQHFSPLLEGRHVLVRTDNRTTVAYINRQGGVHSAALLVMAENLWSWASEHLQSLRALHIPGLENGGADLMSRGGPLDDEWRLQPEVVQQIWTRFGKATVDLFANRSNTHCPLWFSLRPQDRPPLGVDAFAHAPWPRGLLYAFPPLHLIPQLLERVRVERLRVILVAPDRRSAPWYAVLTLMAVTPPWPIPQFRGALSQEADAIQALPTLGQPLQAWLLRGTG